MRRVPLVFTPPAATGMGNSRELLSQDCFGLVPVNIGDQFDTADAVRLWRQRRDIRSVNVLGGKLPCPGHQLPQALRHTLIIGVEADRAYRKFVEAIAILLPQL